MRKRRSTVFVKPGKDVTLYIPTETPAEVIAYMNRLKADGMFSQGIMDIVIKHVLQEQQSVTPSVIEDSLSQNIESPVDDPVLPDESIQARPLAEQERLPLMTGPVPDGQKSFSLAQIFRQAGRNAGKLLQDKEQGRE